jgi:hypothetical protein
MTGAPARTEVRKPGMAAHGFRLVIGLVYLVGAPTHVYMALAKPSLYRGSPGGPLPSPQPHWTCGSPGSFPMPGTSVCSSLRLNSPSPCVSLVVDESRGWDSLEPWCFTSL